MITTIKELKRFIDINELTIGQWIFLSGKLAHIVALSDSNAVIVEVESDDKDKKNIQISLEEFLCKNIPEGVNRSQVSTFLNYNIKVCENDSSHTISATGKITCKKLPEYMSFDDMSCSIYDNVIIDTKNHNYTQKKILVNHNGIIREVIIFNLDTPEYVMKSSIVINGNVYPVSQFAGIPKIIEIFQQFNPVIISKEIDGVPTADLPSYTSLYKDRRLNLKQIKSAIARAVEDSNAIPEFVKDYLRDDEENHPLEEYFELFKTEQRDSDGAFEVVVKETKMPNILFKDLLKSHIVSLYDDFYAYSPKKIVREFIIATLIQERNEENHAIIDDFITFYKTHKEFDAADLITSLALLDDNNFLPKFNQIHKETVYESLQHYVLDNLTILPYDLKNQKILTWKIDRLSFYSEKLWESNGDLVDLLQLNSNIIQSCPYISKKTKKLCKLKAVQAILDKCYLPVMTSHPITQLKQYLTKKQLSSSPLHNIEIISNIEALEYKVKVIIWKKYLESNTFLAKLTDTFNILTIPNMETCRIKDGKEPNTLDFDNVPRDVVSLCYFENPPRLPFDKIPLLDVFKQTVKEDTQIKPEFLIKALIDLVPKTNENVNVMDILLDIQDQLYDKSIEKKEPLESIMNLAFVAMNTVGITKEQLIVHTHELITDVYNNEDEINRERIILLNSLFTDKELTQTKVNEIMSLSPIDVVQQYDNNDDEDCDNLVYNLLIFKLYQDIKKWKKGGLSEEYINTLALDYHDKIAIKIYKARKTDIKTQIDVIDILKDKLPHNVPMPIHILDSNGVRKCAPIYVDEIIRDEKAIYVEDTIPEHVYEHCFEQTGITARKTIKETTVKRLRKGIKFAIKVNDNGKKERIFYRESSMWKNIRKTRLMLRKLDKARKAQVQAQAIAPIKQRT